MKNLPRNIVSFGVIVSAILAFSTNAKCDGMLDASTGGVGTLSAGNNIGTGVGIDASLKLTRLDLGSRHDFDQVDFNFHIDSLPSLNTANISESSGMTVSNKNGTAQNVSISLINFEYKNGSAVMSPSLRYQLDNFNTNTYFEAKLSERLKPDDGVYGTGLGMNLKQQIVKGLNIMLDGNLLVSTEGNLSGDIATALKLNLSDSDLVKNLPVYIKAGVIAEHSATNAKDAQFNLSIGTEYSEKHTENGQMAASAN